MKLDFNQTRRLLLAGTAALPTPFPTVGAITIDPDGKVTRTPGDGVGDSEPLVILEEKATIGSRMTRIIRSSDVAAIFVPDDEKADRIDDFSKGNWILAPVDENACKMKSKKDNGKKCLELRGIVFVPEYASVLSIEECAKTAGDIVPTNDYGCDDPDRGCDR
jgi:hypothetical protein